MSDNTEPLPMPNALAFAGRGYPVFPLHGIVDGKCTCGNPGCGKNSGKHPFAKLAPNGLKNATTDRDTIKEWFTAYPFLNYGLCTDDLPTIDIDPRNGGDRSWQKLVRENYLVDTWQVRTGGGGDHFIFGTTTEPIRNGILAPGIEVKGVGGYIVGVGSLHLSGKRYHFYKGSSPVTTELKAMPKWATDKLKKPEPKNGIHTPEFYNELLAPALPGQRHQKAASLIGHVFSRKPNRGVLLGLVISHIRLTYPDLSDFGDDEIIKIALDLARAEDRKGMAA